MAEPVDPADDWRAIVGRAGPITVQFYDPSLDIPGAATVHGAAQDATGHRGPKAGGYQSTADGEVRVTRTTWYVDCSPLPGRPPMKSLIVDGSDTWVIDAVSPDAADAVHEFQCTLKG